MKCGSPAPSSARRGRAALFASAIAGLWAGAPARAANYFWDPGLSNTDPGSGGTGTWDTTTPIWKLAGTSGDVVWPNTLTNTATFAGTPGTVTVGANLNALGMVFNTAGYTIAPGAGFTFNLGNSATTPSIDLTALSTGGTTTINQALTFTSDQLWNVGTGVLNLGSTGIGNISSGTTTTFRVLTINGGGDGSAGTVTYSGSGLSVAKTVLQNEAIFNVSGTVTTNATASYTAIGNNTDGTLNVIGGTYTSLDTFGLLIGTGPSVAATGTLNVMSGTFNTALGGSTPVDLGNGYGQTGTGGTGTTHNGGVGYLNISGGTFNTGSGTGNIYVGNSTHGAGTINLTGGTLATNGTFTVGTGGATATGPVLSLINFNGGTLQATGAALNVSAGMTANVGSGGVTVDTNGFAALIAANLSSPSGVTGGLNKVGVGTLTLTGSNSYTGNTNVSAGLLAASLTQSLPGFTTAGLITVANGAAISFGYGSTGSFGPTDIQTALNNIAFNTGSGIGLDVVGGVTATYSNNLSGFTNFVKTSAGTLVLGGTQSYAGPTTLAGGLLAAGPTPTTGGLPTGSPIVFNNGGIASSDGTTRTFSGAVTLTGAGATTLTFGGTTAFNTGSLAFTNTTPINLGTTTPTFAVNVPTAFAQGFAGTSATLTETGTGTLTLNGASTLTGGTFTIAAGAGTVVLNNGTALGTDTIQLNATTNATGTLGLTGGITVANSIIPAGSRYDPVLGNGAGLFGVAQIENVSGNNTITSGGLGINGGGLGNIVQSDAGTLTLTGNLSGSNVGGVRGYVLTGAGNGVVSGNISQGAATGLTQVLIKYGTGTWTLSGNNTYSGPTNVSGGTLRVSNTAGSGTGAGPVNVGANTNAGVLAGTGTIGNGTNPVTILQGGTLTAGSGATTADSAGTLTTGTQAWNASGTYVAKYDGTTADQLVMSGLTASSGFVVDFQEKVPGATPAMTYVLAVNEGSTSAGSFNLGGLVLEVNGSTALPSRYTYSDVVAGGFDDLDITVTSAAPEPTSLLLAGLAAGPLAVGRRRRRPVGRVN